MGIVIPFRRVTPPTPPSPSTYYSDLAAVEAIIEHLSYPAIIMLLTGVLLNVLHRKNGGNCAADRADVKEFVRGVRLEIRLQGGSNGAR